MNKFTTTLCIATTLLTTGAMAGWSEPIVADFEGLDNATGMIVITSSLQRALLHRNTRAWSWYCPENSEGSNYQAGRLRPKRLQTTGTPMV